MTEKPDMIVVDPPRMGMHDKAVGDVDEAWHRADSLYFV